MQHVQTHKSHGDLQISNSPLSMDHVGGNSKTMQVLDFIYKYMTLHNNLKNNNMFICIALITQIGSTAFIT